MLVLDITDPTNPSLTSSVTSPGIVRDLGLAGSLVLVANGESGLRLVDMSDSATPIEVGFYETADRAWSVANNGNLALVGGDSGLWIIDISDTANPVQVGFYDTVGRARDVAVTGDLAVFTINEEGQCPCGRLQILDISDPSLPMELGSFDALQSPGRVNISGNLALVVDEFPPALRLLSISDPSNPLEVGSGDLTQFFGSSGVVASGDLALVTARFGGLTVFDISDPTNPTEVGSYQTPIMSPVGVDIIGDLALVSDQQNGLRIINISDPSSPVEVALHSLPRRVDDVAVIGNLALIDVDYATGDVLRIIDLSDPAHPTDLGSYDAPGQDIRGVAASGNLAVIGYEGGLLILRVSGAQLPTPGDVNGDGVVDVRDLAIVGRNFGK